MRYLTFARYLLLAVLCIVSTKCKGRRPSVSKIMPVLELMEPEGAMYDPSPEDIDEGSLKNLLGSFFDSQVMSTEQPSAFTSSPNGTVKLNLKKTRSGQFVPQGPLPKHIKRMHLQFVKMAEGKRIHLKMGNKMRRRCIPRSLMVTELLPVASKVERFRTSILATILFGEFLCLSSIVLFSPWNALQASQISEQGSLTMALPELGSEKEL
ncbi:unnamed protein product [Larinioides sclopetarius]|uniref:Uncharacterized protein n=1 Tax=Larinioides sclopetarius TaxID=280406 RepID=A0AAV2ANK8_9ARAC